MNNEVTKESPSVILRNKVPFLLLLMNFLVWLRPLDNIADDYTSSGLQRAITTFAAARGLNALISLVQGTSFSVGFGLGATIQPGAILDPLDDLVEQFSILMLASSMSFSIQKLMLKILSSWLICTLITAGLLFWSLSAWKHKVPPRWLLRITTGLICLRLAIPLIALSNEAVFHLVLSKEYNEAQAQIASAEGSETKIIEDDKLTEKLKRWLAQDTDIDDKIEKLKSTADNLTKHIVSLAVIFFLPTILLPLLFLWILLKFYRILFSEISQWIQFSQTKNYSSGVYSKKRNDL